MPTRQVLKLENAKRILQQGQDKGAKRACNGRQTGGGLKVVKAAASRQRGSGGEWQVTDKRYKGMQSNKAKEPLGNGAREQKKLSKK